MDARDREHAGLQRHVDIGLRIAPSAQAAALARKSLAMLLSEYPEVPVRVVGLGRDATRVEITIAITLGTLEAVKTSARESQDAIALIQAIVDRLASFDPSLVEIPDPMSADAVFDTSEVQPTRARDGRDGLLSLIG